MQRMAAQRERLRQQDRKKRIDHDAADELAAELADRPDRFSDDGLHPSEPSQRRLAKIIAGALAPRLAAKALPAPGMDD